MNADDLIDFAARLARTQEIATPAEPSTHAAVSDRETVDGIQQYLAALDDPSGDETL